MTTAEVFVSAIFSPFLIYSRNPLLTSTFPFPHTSRSKSACQDYFKKGPAVSIGPLSGEPNRPEIDLDYTYTPNNDQPALQQTPKKKGKKGAAAAQAYEEPPSPPRARRKSAQKAADGFRKEAEERDALIAARLAREAAAALIKEEDGEANLVEEEKPLAPRRDGFDEEGEVKRIQMLEARLAMFGKPVAGPSSGGSGAKRVHDDDAYNPKTEEDEFWGGKKVKLE
jgi:hypothetical protein